MTGGDTAGISQLVSRDHAADDLGRAVRLFTRGDPAWTIKRVAEEAGISYRRMQDLMENDPGDRRYATWDEALSILAVIGTRGASSCLRRIGMVAEPEEAEPESVSLAAAELARDAGELAVLAVDGIDLDEADAADRAADRAIANAVALKSAAAKARRRRR